MVIEGAEVEYQNTLGKIDGWAKLSFQLSKYRIKPSEPVYEWQWKYKDDNTKLWTYSKYMTDAEFNSFEYCSVNIAIKDEETKRPRA